MIDELKLQCCSAYEEKIRKIDESINCLRRENRVDEINQLKAARNVYGIYTDMLNVAQKQSNNDTKTFAKVYARLLFKMPSEWMSARAKANEHDDVARVAIEDSKIGACADIAKIFAGIIRDSGEVKSNG